MALASTRLDVLRGTLDHDNPLNKLRGNALVWSDVFGRVSQWYEQHVDTDSPVPFKCAQSIITFPKPRGININMMPIQACPSTYGGFLLPEEYSHYRQLVGSCTVPWQYYRNTTGTTERVAYLTIHEERVPVGQAHRRPGLHIESPVVAGGGSRPDQVCNDLSWGCGHWHQDVLVDGIYMASNVADSCAVWPCLINQPVDVVDRHGGMEHMRQYMLERTRTRTTGAQQGPKLLGAGELCWITDRTPHESLPLKPPNKVPQAGELYRQFFRLVVGPIDVWYVKHNTLSPLGVQPDAVILYEDKFAADLSAALPE